MKGNYESEDIHTQNKIVLHSVFVYIHDNYALFPSYLV
jgi:hypothetical protein